MNSRQWVEFKNGAGEDIPAFGCIRLSGLTIPETGRVTRTGNKPNTYGSQYLHAFNGPVVCKSGEYGMCVIGQEMVALYDSSDGTPAFGEKWGPRDATWKLKKNTGGFQIVGVTNSTKALALVVQSPMLSFIGKTDSSHAKSASGTISVWAGTTIGSESDTTANITAYNRFAAVGSGKWVRCEWNNDAQQFELGSAEC